MTALYECLPLKIRTVPQVMNTAGNESLSLKPCLAGKSIKYILLSNAAIFLH